MNIYFFMNHKFEYYEDRVKKIDETKTLEKYCSDHLVCFERLVCSAEVSNEDIQEMIKFYDKLLKIVDKALGIKYSYGKIFKNAERNLLEDSFDDRIDISSCPQNRITCFVPKKLFNVDTYKENKQYANKIKYSNWKKYIVLDFFDTKKVFTWMDLWDIKEACEGPIHYFLELTTLTNNEMTIFFDY
jgi:hypothetical protein